MYSVGIVDGLVGDIVCKLVCNNCVASVVGWELTDMVPRRLVPTQKLQQKPNLSCSASCQTISAAVHPANDHDSQHFDKMQSRSASCLCAIVGLQRPTALRPATVALVPVAGVAPDGPQTCNGWVRPLAIAYSGAKSVMWSLCRCDKKTCKHVQKWLQSEGCAIHCPCGRDRRCTT